MGTTSAGRSGSGSGLGSNGGGTWSDGGGILTYSRGIMTSKLFSDTDIKREVTETLGALFARASTYIKESFTNKFLLELYDELFIFSKLLRENENINKIAKRYDLETNEPGFIFSLILKLFDRFSKTGIDSRSVDNVRITLERFIFISVGDNHDVAIEGNGSEVIVAMKENKEFWGLLSEYFLSTLLNVMFSKEVEKKVPDATFAIQKELANRTRKIITNFEKSKDGEKVNFSKIFEYISNNWESFKRELING